MPSCIDIRIEEARRSGSNPPLEVWRWETANGITYFYFTSDCCDQYNYLYDTNCNEVCAPDGGLTGEGDGRCPEFAEPVEKRLVWKGEYVK